MTVAIHRMFTWNVWTQKPAKSLRIGTWYGDVIPMNRTVNLGATGVMGRDEFFFEIQQNKIATWIAEWALLLGDFVQVTKILFDRDWSISFTIDRQREARMEMKTTGEGALSCVIPGNEADSLQAFLLRAYRDGMAAVNHIHIEGTLDGRTFDLTVGFDTSAPGISAEEAEKIILGNR